MKNESQSLTHKALKGMFWMFSGNLLLSLLQFFVLIFLARLIAPEEFGVISISLVVIRLAQIFSQMGVNATIVQRPELTDEHKSAGFWMSLIFGIFFMLIVWACSAFLARFFQTEELETVLKVISLVFLINGLYVVPYALLQRNLKFDKIAKSDLLSYLFGYGLVGIVLAYLGYGVWALVFAQITQSLVQCVFLNYFQPYTRRLKMKREVVKELMFFGGGFTLAKLGNYAANQGDKLIAGRLLLPADLGIYDRAYQLMFLPTKIIGVMLDKVLFPVMAEVQNDPDKLSMGFRRGSVVVALTTLPFMAISYLLADEIIMLLLGPQWTMAVPVFQWLVLATFFRTSLKLSDSMARATGLVYERAWRQWIYAGTVVAGSWIGATEWGIEGVSVGVGIAIFINFALMLNLSFKVTSIKLYRYVLIHLPVVALSVVVFAITWWCSGYLRSRFNSDFVVLTLSMMTAFVSALLLFRSLPSVFINGEMRWATKLLLDMVKEKFPRRKTK